jgi:hypothetical protein
MRARNYSPRSMLQRMRRFWTDGRQPGNYVAAGQLVLNLGYTHLPPRPVGRISPSSIALPNLTLTCLSAAPNISLLGRKRVFLPSRRDP